MNNTKQFSNFKCDYNEIPNLFDKNNDELDEETINKLMEKEFGYPNFETFQKDFYEKIERAHADIAEGRTRTFEEFIKEMEGKYKFIWLNIP